MRDGNLVATSNKHAGDLVPNKGLGTDDHKDQKHQTRLLQENFSQIQRTDDINMVTEMS